MCLEGVCPSRKCVHNPSNGPLGPRSCLLLHSHFSGNGNSTGQRRRALVSVVCAILVDMITKRNFFGIQRPRHTHNEFCGLPQSPNSVLAADCSRSPRCTLHKMLEEWLYLHTTGHVMTSFAMWNSHVDLLTLSGSLPR